MQLLFRPQSLYLLLAALCAGSMFLFPFATFELSSNVHYELNAMGFFNHENVVVVDVAPLLPFNIVVPLLAAILLVTMFMFKKRKRQMAVSRSAYLISVLIIGGSYLAINSFKAYLGVEQGVKIGYDVSFYLPFAVLAFTFLANRSIKKDEDLVRSLDRLR